MKIITTHKNTDFDALASVIAATLLYPEAFPVLPYQIKSNVKDFLSLHKDLFNIRTWKEINHSEVNGLIVVDACKWDRLSVPDEIRNKKDLDIILYDHHPEAGDIEAFRSYRDHVGANITLMLREVKRRNMKLSAIQTTLFLAGLYEDTGNLSFLGTTPEDVHTGAFLLENQADLLILSYMLRPNHDEMQKKLFLQMVESSICESINGFKVLISAIHIDAFIDDLATLVQRVREMSDTEAAFGLFADTRRNSCIVIARSVNDQIDVGAIMRAMGGGGNPGAGSAVLKEISFPAILNRIRNLLMEKHLPSVRIRDLMSSPAICIQDDDKVEEIIALLRDKGYTGFPVVNSHGELVGMLSRRDVQRKVKKDRQLKIPIKAIMSMRVVTISPEKSPIEATQLMVENDIGRLPVVENGQLIGIVSRSDMMKYWYHLVPDGAGDVFPDPNCPPPRNGHST